MNRSPIQAKFPLFGISARSDLLSGFGQEEPNCPSPPKGQPSSTRASHSNEQDRMNKKSVFAAALPEASQRCSASPHRVPPCSAPNARLCAFVRFCALYRRKNRALPRLRKIQASFLLFRLGSNHSRPVFPSYNAFSIYFLAPLGKHNLTH